MPVTESDLPGVGKKFEIDLEERETLVVVIHNTGRRDVFLKEDAEADSTKLFELSDELARVVGTILEGAYFQPIRTEDRATELGDGTVIEWYDIERGAELEGESIGAVLEDERIDIAIVAVQRGDEVISASRPQKEIRAGDTVVAVGSSDDLEAFRTLIE